MDYRELPILLAPYVKSKGFNPAPLVTNGIPDYADGAKNPKVIGTPEYETFWTEQLYRCINGYNTGGIFIPGRFYYYMNFNNMNTVHGIITPDFCDMHLELCYIIEWCKANGKNLIIGKKRRAGISEFTQKAVIDYGYRFSESYQAGIAAGQKKYAEDFMTKWEDSEALLQNEFRVNSLLNNPDEVVSGYELMENGKTTLKNNACKIFVRTMHNNPNMFKGLFLNDVVAEESGEFENLCEFISATNDCLMDGDTQVGTFMIYGCVCAGTKVWNNKGELVNIEDLIHSDGIIGYNENDFKYSKEEIIYWQLPAKKECYRITTNSGRILECSHDHPILRREFRYYKNNTVRQAINSVSFIETENLEVGDRIAILDGVDIWSDKNMFDPRLIGWLVGDGTYGKGQNVTLCNADKEMWEYLEEYYEVIDQCEPTKTKDGRTLRKARILGITAELEEIGIRGQTKDNKRLPNNIHSYCKKDVCDFIGGYFDADGCAYFNKKTGEGLLKLTSANLEILKEMQLLLQKLAIKCNISYEKPNFNNPKTTRGHYNLIIKDRKSLLEFHKNISFSIKYKQDNLNLIFDYSKKVSKDRNGGFNGMRFEEVVSVEYIGIKDIYNLTAGNTHTYVANGIITHNTGGNINKGSKDFKKVWENPNDYNAVKYLITGDRFKKPFYGGATRFGKDVSVTPNLLKKYKPYQIIGMEDTEAAMENIMAERERLKKGELKKYMEHLQNNPINEAEIFRKMFSNNFDIQKINAQQDEITVNKNKYSKWKLEWVTNDKGDRVNPLRVKVIPAKDIDDEGDCILILDEYHPDKKYKNLYVGGIDPYDQDKGVSKSLGAMCVMTRPNTFGIPFNMPVAVICTRPKRKEIFFDMCLKLSVYYDLVGNTLGDKAGSSGIIKWYENHNCMRYLAPRPKKFESMNSGQSHDFWVSLTTYSRPLMVGAMQTSIHDYCQNIWFPELINQLGNFDEVEIGSDNDLADAYGIALMQSISVVAAPRDDNAKESEDPFSLGNWITDKNGNIVPAGDFKRPTNPEEDYEYFGS